MHFFRIFFVVLAAAATISSVSVLAQERTAVRQGFSLPANSGKTILLFRPTVRVGSQSTAGMFEPNADWTAQGREQLGTSLKNLQSRLGNRVIEAPEPVGEEALFLSEHMSLFAAVSTSVINYQFFVGNRLPTKKQDNRNDVFEWTLGPQVAQLPGAADADYGLFIYTEDQYGSTGRKLLQFAAAFAGVGVQSGVHSGYAGLVDLKTGELLWLNADGQMGGDVRTSEGAEKRMRQLLEEFPGSVIEEAKAL
ncbi:hypothetical protein [uncultured Sphingopyxis sp.]|jgi:hypothetical protein|uniref:hypothetical protein n=1 Tax=uncultured Sphingopyxis sp. TaxID=310581 RepID=UPI000AFAAFEA|nr:hypothetical protein [uncultured Sphingopyxis sp.]